MRVHVCIWRPCKKDPSAALGMTKRGSGWGTGVMKESGKERLKSTIYESTLSTAPRSPFPAQVMLLS